MQEKPRKAVRRRAVTPLYVSPTQLTLCGFETPFELALTSTNRWVKLSGLLPWDSIVKPNDAQFKSEEGIRAKLKNTSESWIATITLVPNLVNLTRLGLVSLNLTILKIKICYFGRQKIYAEFRSRP